MQSAKELREIVAKHRAEWKKLHREGTDAIGAIDAASVASTASGVRTHPLLRCDAAVGDVLDGAQSTAHGLAGCAPRRSMVHSPRSPQRLIPKFSACPMRSTRLCEQPRMPSAEERSAVRTSDETRPSDKMKPRDATSQSHAAMWRWKGRGRRDGGAEQESDDCGCRWSQRHDGRPTKCWR